jgi:hypothetical protein
MSKMQKIYALTPEDVNYLGMAPSVAGGWITAWGEEDNGLALPEIVKRVTGRPYLGTMPGVSPEYGVSARTIEQILQESDAQQLTSTHRIIMAARQQRETRHAQILGKNGVE